MRTAKLHGYIHETKLEYGPGESRPSFTAAMSVFCDAAGKGSLITIPLPSQMHRSIAPGQVLELRLRVLKPKKTQ